MDQVNRSRTVADTVLARLALVGADAGDDEDTRSSKALLVVISVLILPISLLWGPDSSRTIRPISASSAIGKVSRQRCSRRAKPRSATRSPW